MVLFIILLIMALLIGIAAIFAIGTIGAGALLVFAEPIICIILLILLVRAFLRKKK